jgi:hypothetical protein
MAVENHDKKEHQYPILSIASHYSPKKRVVMSRNQSEPIRE